MGPTIIGLTIEPHDIRGLLVFMPYNVFYNSKHLNSSNRTILSSANEVKTHTLL